jgi:hypothetical protein
LPFARCKLIGAMERFIAVPRILIRQ